MVTIDRTRQFIVNLPDSYFGIVQLQFVNADVVMVRKEETIKPQVVSVAV